MEFDSIVDNSTLEEPEDFIDSAYHMGNVGATPNIARAVGTCTPRQTGDTQTVAEAQLFTFKGKVETQIEKLLTIVSEQNHSINKIN